MDNTHNEVPLSAVGVRHGTKTHSKIQETGSLSDPSSINASIKGPHLSNASANAKPGAAGIVHPSPFDTTNAVFTNKDPMTQNAYLASMMMAGGSMGNLPNVSLAQLPSGLSNLPTIPGLSGLPIDMGMFGSLLGNVVTPAGATPGTHPTMMQERNAQAIVSMLSKQSNAGAAGAVGALGADSLAALMGSLPNLQAGLTGALGSMEFAKADSFQKNLDGILASGNGVQHKDGNKDGNKDKQMTTPMSLNDIQQLLSFNANPQLLAASLAAGGGTKADEGGDKVDMATLDSQQLLDRSIMSKQGTSLDLSEKIVLDNVLEAVTADAAPKESEDVDKKSGEKKDAMATTQSNLYAQGWGVALKNAEKAAEDEKHEKEGNVGETAAAAPAT